MITTLRRSTIALLASSLLLTIGRGATLPFMTIYLTRRFQLEVDVIGYALSLALVVGVLFSMGSGILADRFDKKAPYGVVSAGVYSRLQRNTAGQ
ncbi:hypothetical protein LNQ03_31200 [Klebsiella pneumoniae subsp. pneumoniae]|nr:hypothetical protein [Klebsiella pneumoniae subsp. pneumoniae]